MSFVLVALLSLTSFAQDAVQNREKLNQLLHDLEMRSRVQTVLITEHESANVVESRRLFLEIAQLSKAEMDVQTGVFTKVGHGFSEIPETVRTFGRKQGKGFMTVLIAFELANYVGPVFLVMLGEPGLAATIVALPLSFAFIPALIAIPKVIDSKRANKIYGSRKIRLALEKKQHEELAKQGVSSLETDKILAGNVISSGRNSSNPDALNLKRVKKYLKIQGWWNDRVSKIAQDSKWSKNEKSILLLSQLESEKQFDPSTVVPDSELERWAIDTSEILEFPHIRDQLSRMPTAGVKASTLYRFWRYTFIPVWIERMKGKKLKPFRCISKNKIGLAAAANQAGDRLWDSSDDQFIHHFLDQCKL